MLEDDLEIFQRMSSPRPRCRVDDDLLGWTPHKEHLHLLVVFDHHHQSKEQKSKGEGKEEDSAKPRGEEIQTIELCVSWSNPSPSFIYLAYAN